LGLVLESFFLPIPLIFINLKTRAEYTEEAKTDFQKGGRSAPQSARWQKKTARAGSLGGAGTGADSKTGAGKENQGKPGGFDLQGDRWKPDCRHIGSGGLSRGKTLR
jgi:hypothetical protein